MNKTKYLQTDSRWGGLGYPKAPYYLRNCGCGEVAICNIIIEMEQYRTQTPKTILSYCRQYADPNGNGTYWSGIPAMMKHYGLTEVQEHATMKPLWSELAKGNRVAVFLMGNKKAGNKGVKWSGSAHFICAVAYKYENSKHYVYVKDSASNSSLRNGWISYEDNMRNDVMKVWSGKLNSKAPAKPYEPTTAYTGGLPTGTVKKGSKGDDVKMLQKFLNWCLNAKLDVDGVAGDKTVSAIKKFQSQYGLEADGIFGANSKAKAQAIVKAHAQKEVPKTTKASLINQKALEFAWKVGTPEKVYKYPSGKPDPDFITAWKKYFPKRKINCGCHQYVMLVLKACGYPTMPLEWKNILKYLRTNFKEIKVNYTQAQLKAGDIRVHKNSSGGYHIWVIVEQNGKFYRAEANQTGNKRYAHINTSNKGNATKHKADWLFRAK